MATDGQTPAPCIQDIFKNGKGVCVVDGSSNDVELWVQLIAKTADTQVDWHYSGGRANVLHLGDEESRQRVLNAIEQLQGELKGSILSVGGPALYRAGDEIPQEENSSPPIIIDSIGMAIGNAVGKHNCKKTFELNADRVDHFKKRLSDRGMTATDAVIVIVNVDDVHGGPLADALMPGSNWQEFRDRGEIPFARGLAMRTGIEKSLDFIDKDAATKLREMTDVAVVVVDHGVAEVFSA